jgi:hypothetical protein
MRKICLILSAFLAFTLIPVRAQELPFAGGEEVSYTIHYKYGINADLASLKITSVQEKNDLHVTAFIKTFRLWDSFYKMRDRYEATFELAPGLKPRTAMRDVKEGNYWAKCNYTWGNDLSSVHAVIDKHNRPHRDTVLHEDGTIRDIFNMIYFCRAADFNRLEKGAKIQEIVAMDRTVYHVTVRYAGREKKKVNGKTWNTVKMGISLKVRSGERGEGNTPVTLGDTDDDFVGGEKLWFWLTDDGNRLPVFFSANLRVGSIQGRLAEVSGNKYPFTSKTD